MSDSSGYPSTARPVVGRRMVVASQPLAAQAGLRMLDAGGNAIDAAIAAAAVIAVVEPTNNSIGGDAFAMFWDGTALHGLNASGRAPLLCDPAAVAARHGGRMPRRGWDTVTVPGAVSAWAVLWENRGRLPFEQVLQPAIEYARDGFFVSQGVAEKWLDQAQELRTQPGFAAAFLPSGRPPAIGERFRQPDLAETLTRIGASQGRDFYHGITAERIAAFAEQHGAALAKTDLARHQADWCTPLSTRYENVNVYEMPPNGQGIVALYALAILQRLGVERHPVDSAQSLHLQIEALKLAFAEVAPWVADPDQMSVKAGDWLTGQRIAAAVARIDATQAQDFSHPLPALAGTVYLAVGDDEGRMVSYIQSNYMGFGSGVVVPGTGVALQNRGAGFSLDPAAPARLAPGVRPFHTILPGFLRGEDGSLAAVGSTGGSFQPQGHLQLAVRMLTYGQNPQAVVDAPRFKVDQGLRVALEPGFAPDVVAQLSAMGHDITALESTTWDFGGMQILVRQNGHYMGGRDARRDSHIAVS